jgi:hypothetical protein
MSRLMLCAVVALALSIHVAAGEPKQPDPKEGPMAQPAAPEKEKGELLPAPRRVIPEFVGPYVLPSLPPQPGTREVWQYYGVDRSGRFLPRVILAPYDRSYYLYNGQPYPWTTTRPELHMPYALD